MSRRRPPLGSQIVALVALLALLLAVAGCGGETATSAGTGPSPAAVAPADAVAYVELLARPDGEAREGVVAAARAVLQVDDPGAEVRRLVDRALADVHVAGRPSFARDVEPWLGRRAGLFFLPDGLGDEPRAAFVANVRDRDALEQELERLRDAGELRAGGRVGGVAYDVTDDDEPTGIVGDQLVFASSLPAFRAAVAAADGDSLAEASRYEDALERIPDEALAFLYIDPQRLAGALRGAADVDPAARRLLASPRVADADPVVASLTADADQVALEASFDASLADEGGADAGGAVSVGELPGDAWLALATPPLGPLVRQALDAAGVHDEAAEKLRGTFGVDLDRDLLGPLGGLGLFVRGTNPLNLGGGVLLRMSDAAAARRLVTMAQTLVEATVAPTAPVQVGGARGFRTAIAGSLQPIVVLAKGDEIAAGYAASSAQDLLDPQERFDEGSSGQAAIETLGEGYTPSFVLLVPPLAELLRALDQLQVADLSSALPYVTAYRSLAAGTRRDGDRTTVRVVAALR